MKFRTDSYGQIDVSNALKLLWGITTGKIKCYMYVSIHQLEKPSLVTKYYFLMQNYNNNSTLKTVCEYQNCIKLLNALLC